MSTPARSTRAEQKDRTREDIRVAALDLFESRGFDSTTIDDITAAASVGRRTFFRYFSCKEAVLFSGGVFQNMAVDLREALSSGLPPVRALIWAIERDAYGADDPDEVTIRRRRARVSLLEIPTVAAYYRSEVARIAQVVTHVVHQYPAHASVRFLPELVGGLLHTMTLEHLESGETHHFAVDAEAWRTALITLERGFDA
ncbi:TetR family transcriptional regulator [Glaciihabitans tibetensis]|nr:TetR family transcriptional regulator [Glaciihabitans tibetensis]